MRKTNKPYLSLLGKVINNAFDEPVLRIVRWFHYFPQDLWDVLMGRREEFVPPKRLLFTGSNAEEFKKKGQEFLKYFIDLGGLKPYHKFLDVGCGIGQTAAALRDYLSAETEYHGIDIVPYGICWCQKNISRRYPNFHFKLADVYNKYYQPKGKYSASEYRFPYPDSSFDFAYLGSVFTHMLPQDLPNYLREINRTLKKSGRCLITFFLLNDESLRLIKDGKSSLLFHHPVDKGSLSVHEKRPEMTVAQPENWICDLYSETGFRIIDKIHYGSWCGRTEFLSYQDVILAEKEF